MIKKFYYVKMDLTGDEKQDLQTISTYNIKEIKRNLRKYDKHNYGLVLADYPNRDQLYKDEIFVWII